MRTLALAPALALALAACGSDAPPAPPSIAPEPPASLAAPPSSPPPTSAPPASVAAPPTSAPPATSVAAPAPTIADALAPSHAATLLAEIVRGRTHYVLYALDGYALARDAVADAPGGAARLERIDDEIADCEEECPGGWPTLECLVPVISDVNMAGHAICDSSHSIGVARVGEHEGAFTLEQQRLLFAFSCSGGVGLADEIRAADLDGDGADEVTVIFAITPPDTDDLANEDGRLGYVLDGRDLHTQFRASREWYAVIGDVGGSSSSGELVWRVLPADADGHHALHVRSHGSDATQDDESGDSDSSPFDTQADCPYDVGADVWNCPATVREYYFGGPRERLGEAWVAETPEALLVGRREVLGSTLSQPREDEDEDEDDGEEEGEDEDEDEPE